jgi:methionine synthase II (cobalamin-independent)
MFGTLLGGLPPPPIASDVSAGDEMAAALVAVVRAQEDAGLVPISDGRLATPDLVTLVAGLAGVGTRATGGAPTLEPGALPRWREPLTVDTWRATAALTERPTKQALPGPYSVGHRIARGQGASTEERARITLAFAEALHEEVAALAAVGCPLIEIEETEAHRIGGDDAERQLFRDAHHRLIDGVATHLSLSIVGGSAAQARAEVLLDAPYSSLAVDLIAGPDNWALVGETPGNRGIVAGALATLAGFPDGTDVLLYAARYAASTRGRGMERVGLGTAGGLATSSWTYAVEKMRRLGEAARLLNAPVDEQAEALDPRAVSSRAAATGRRRKPKRD